jgi:hypothetical protein
MVKIHGNVKHGASSHTVASKFADRRTEQGRDLHLALTRLIDHFGGPDGITSPMSLLIDSCVRPKLIILLTISSWVAQQSSDAIVDKSGRMPDVLGKNWLAYCNSLRLDLRELSVMAKDAGANIKPPDLASLIGGK